MEEELLNLKNKAVALIISAQDEEEIDKLFSDFLGKNGKLTEFTKRLKGVPLEQRPELGKLTNEIKRSIKEMIDERRNLSKKADPTPKKNIDITIPGKKPLLGSLHLITQAIEEISLIFEKIGFDRVRYPEIEWDWYAFGSLNFPKDHPARDEWETFFIDTNPDPKMGPMILTPHTSSGQTREMMKVTKSHSKNNKGAHQPSSDSIKIKMLNIAKCYRRQSDISHTQMFHQFEGFVVGEGINISHLKGVLSYFVKSYFGEKRKIRIRPYQFQFTEPSFEIDVSCGVCNGTAKLQNEQKCRLCKAGWLEMGGSGMTHPKVLENGGIDPNKYTGFAFGWGVERVLMMKEGIEIDDLRLLYSNRLEFLKQF